MNTPYRPTLFSDWYRKASALFKDKPDFLPHLAGLGVSWYGASMPSMEAMSLSDPAAVQYDTFGRPVYTAGRAMHEALTFKPRGATGGDILSGAVTGAQVGSAFGAPGAIVGTLVGALGSVLFGERRRKREREARRRAISAALASQELYNKASSDYDRKSAAQQSWIDKMNATNRLYNLYGGPQLIYY